MIHLIHGYMKNEDSPSFSTQLHIRFNDLKRIMGWTRDDECAFTYDLTKVQAIQIKGITGLELPDDMDLQLSTYTD